MSGADWEQPGSSFPDGSVPATRRWPAWLKLMVLLTLVMALGWVLLITAQYCSTKKPLGDLGAVPGPVSDLFDKPAFEYVSSIEGLKNPMGVAVGQDGRIYVTETGGERKIHIYDASGQEVGSFAPAETQPASRVPVYVAVSPDGNIYVSDRGAVAIFIFSPDGTPQGQVTPPAGYEDWHPLALAFDDAGNLYVGDVTADKHRLIVLDPEGNLKLAFGTQGEEDGEFWYPNGIVVDSEGHIFVADSNNGRLQAFDKDGKLLFKISRGMSPGDLSMPRGIAIDSDGRLLIADTSRSAVQAYMLADVDNSDPKEAPVEFLGAFSGDELTRTFFRFPNGLALDGQGQIFIADRANDRVQIWKY